MSFFINIRVVLLFVLFPCLRVPFFSTFHINTSSAIIYGERSSNFRGKKLNTCKSYVNLKIKVVKAKDQKE